MKKYKSVNFESFQGGVRIAWINNREPDAIFSSKKPFRPTYCRLLLAAPTSAQIAIEHKKCIRTPPSSVLFRHFQHAL